MRGSNPDLWRPCTKYILSRRGTLGTRCVLAPSVNFKGLSCRRASIILFALRTRLFCTHTSLHVMIATLDGVLLSYIIIWYSSSPKSFPPPPGISVDIQPCVCVCREFSHFSRAPICVCPSRYDYNADGFILHTWTRAHRIDCALIHICLLHWLLISARFSF